MGIDGTVIFGIETGHVWRQNGIHANHKNLFRGGIFKSALITDNVAKEMVTAVLCKMRLLRRRVADQ
jgi:hypothetical protein